jgi:L-fucose mutarotase/ribose pyranase (RbsD/FucU family)
MEVLSLSSLTSTNVKLESEKLELIKMKGVNVSALCRDAIDSYLKLNSTDKAVIKSQITDLQQQRNSIDLQIKLLLKQLETCENEDVLSTHRNAMYDKWKTNMAFMVNKKTIDWGTISDVFKFSTRAECEAYIINRLKEDGLIN